MSLHKIPELKKAVLSLPQKEKDKLLVRLVGKDKMLIKQLHFQLLENENDLEERVEELRNTLRDLFDNPPYRIYNSPNFRYLDALTKLIKAGSGLINEHEKVTKDKVSEVEFRLTILKRSIDEYPELFQFESHYAYQKLYKYFAGRIKHLLTKWSKLHEDLQFDVKSDLQELLTAAHSLPMAYALRELEIPKEV